MNTEAADIIERARKDLQGSLAKRKAKYGYSREG